MGFVYIYRTVVLTLSLILTIPLLGLVAHWTWGSNVGHQTLAFEPLGLFTASFTLVTIPILLILPQIRKNAFVLYVVSELTIVGLLWILWVVAAALAIQQKEQTYPFDNCEGIFLDQVHWCNELFAIVGLSVVVFVLLLKYMLFLGIYATVMTFRVGGRVWFQSVRDLQIKLPAMTHAAGGIDPDVKSAHAYQPVPLTGYGAPVPAGARGPVSDQQHAPYPQTYTPQPQQPQNLSGGLANAYNTPSPQVAMQVVPTQTLARPVAMV